MTYNRTLQLFFIPASFALKDGSQTKSENSPISLTYIADAHEYHPQPLTTEKHFFLQIMRAQLQCLQQSQISVKDLLNFVSSSWDAASIIIEQAHILGVSYITEPTITSDEAMAIRSFILLRAMRTKVQVSFEVKVRSGESVAALGIEVKADAIVYYGENLKEKNMADVLESWAAAV
jgi:kinetochore protein Spc7/SPC105